MTKNQESHIAWIDLLRILACFVVVLSHSCDPFNASFYENLTTDSSGIFIGSLTRACVPLFVMITGVLLLPIKMDMTTFYKKRAKRILIPLVIWAIITPILFYLYLNFVEPNSANAGLDMSGYTWQATLSKMYTFIFNFNYDTTPLWYLYMLIGLYLFMPILGAWLSQASQQDMKRFLYIWVFTTILPYIKIIAPMIGYEGNYGHIGLLGECDWNPYGTFYYFSGFIGYLVLAHYLMRFPLKWSWTKTLCTTIPMFVAGYLVASFGLLKMQELYPGNYAYLEIMWYFSGLNVLMMTFAVFVIVSKLKVKPSPLMNKVANLTFGVYLCHFILVQFGFDIVFPIDLPTPVKIFMVAIIAFTISLFVSWVLSLTKITRKAIM